MRKGLHLLVDAYGCKAKTITDTDSIKALLLQVTDAVGLRPLSDAMVYAVDEHMIHPEDTGVTGGIIFMESHFTIHTFPARGYMSCDIYSCKTFDSDDVVRILTAFAEPSSMHVNTLRRGNSLPFTRRDMERLLNDLIDLEYWRPQSIAFIHETPDPETYRDLSMALNECGGIEYRDFKITGSKANDYIKCVR